MDNLIKEITVEQKEDKVYVSVEVHKYNGSLMPRGFVTQEEVKNLLVKQEKGKFFIDDLEVAERTPPLHNYHGNCKKTFIFRDKTFKPKKKRTRKKKVTSATRKKDDILQPTETLEDVSLPPQTTED